MIDKVRDNPGQRGLVTANGGFLTEHAAGIYSTEPADWSANDRFEKLPKQQDGLWR